MAQRATRVRRGPDLRLLSGVLLVVACGAGDPVVPDDIDPRWSFGEPLPMPMASFGATVFHEEIYIAGGLVDTGASQATFRYGRTGWERLGDMPSQRNGLQLVVAGDSLYAVAGQTHLGNNAYTRDRQLLVFDPALGEWLPREREPDPRSGVATTGGDRIVIVGGSFGSEDHGGLFPGDSVVLYEPSVGEWRYASPLTIPRIGPMVANIEGDIYTFVGRHVFPNSGTVDAIEIYNVVTDTWRSGSTVPLSVQENFGPAYAALGQTVHFFGGFAPVPPTGAYFDVHMVYDATTTNWTRSAFMPTARSGAVAIAFQGSLWVMGGIVATRALPSFTTDAVEIFTP